MVFIKNTQRRYPIDQAKFKKMVQVLLDAVGYGDFDVSVWLTTNATIRKYNKQYRHKDVATDVLSFSYYENISPKRKIKPKKGDEKILGDIIISVEYAFATAAAWRVSGPERLKELAVHGVCHLVGYDHQTEAQYAQMHRKEVQLLEKIKNFHMLGDA